MLARKNLLSVTVVCLGLLYTTAILDHALWTPDEPRVAAVGKSVANGAWVTPLLNDRPFLKQPPLHAWCVGLFYRAFGTFAAHRPRLLSALFGLGGLILTALLARRLVGSERPRVPCLAALCLGLSLEYYSTAHRLVVDGLLTFLVLAAVYFFFCGLESSRPVQSWCQMALGLFATSLAFLTKGVIGIAVPGLFCLAWLILRRRPSRLFLPVFCLGPVILGLVAGPWLFLLHEQLGRPAFETLFVENTIGRIAGAEASRGHVRPVYYYAVFLPVHFLPTTLALAGALITRFRNRESLPKRERFAYNLSFLWLGLGLLMLSLASTKRAIYLTPLLPAAAIPCGLWVDGFLDRRHEDLYARVFPYLLVGFLVLAGIAVPIAALWLGGISTAAISATVTGMAFALLALRAVRRQDAPRALGPWLAGLTLVLMLALAALIPGADRIKSLGPVSREIGKLVPADEPIYVFRPDETTESLFPLYADRPAIPVETVAQVKANLAHASRLYVVTIDKTYRPRHRRYEAMLPFGPRVLIEELQPQSRAIRLLVIEATE